MNDILSNEVPEGLRGRHIELTRWQVGPVAEMQMPWQCSLRDELRLIERVTALCKALETIRQVASGEKQVAQDDTEGMAAIDRLAIEALKEQS